MGKVRWVQCPDVALSSPCVPAIALPPSSFKEYSLPPSDPDVLIKRLDPGVPLPSYAHPGDAGADLTAAEDVELAPGERALVRTGLAIALPAGYAAFVHPRSGLAAKYGVTLVNAPGTVAAGYRAEFTGPLLNPPHDQAHTLQRAARTAHLHIP